MEEVKISTEFIKLDQFLKWTGICDTGVDAKFFITEGNVFSVRPVIWLVSVPLQLHLKNNIFCLHNFAFYKILSSPSSSCFYLYTENLSLPVFSPILAYKKDTCQNLPVPLLALRPCSSTSLPLNNFHFSKNKNTMKFFTRQ